MSSYQMLGTEASQALSQEKSSCLINPLQTGIQNILLKVNIRICYFFVVCLYL